MLLHAATQNERSKLPAFLHIFQRSPWASVTSVSRYSSGKKAKTRMRFRFSKRRIETFPFPGSDKSDASRKRVASSIGPEPVDHVQGEEIDVRISELARHR